MKKFIFKVITIFSLIFIFFTINSRYIFADDIESEVSDDITINTSANIDSDLSNINSRAYVVIDRATNLVLVGKNETQKRKMASTTKIMTATVIIENCNLSDTVEISKKSAGTGGSRLGLKVGDKITVNDLLYGLMLCSGNDAAVALAEYCSGSVEEFAKKMNEKASSLGLSNTHFITPHGLDSDEHYTTAYELALLTNYALKNDIFAKIVGTQNYTVTINGYPKALKNTNELLGNLNGVYGVKTGFTNGANRCLVTSCKRNGMDIICVVLGADTKNFRTKDSISLIEYCFSNFEPFNIGSLVKSEFENWKNLNTKNFTFEKGTNVIPIFILEDFPYDTILIKKDQKNVDVIFDCDYNLVAPLFKNSSVGKVSVMVNNELLSSCDIILNNDIYKNGINDYLALFFKNYLVNINDLL